jgi:threonine/homoserine/homoserine lactone efflux protein
MTHRVRGAQVAALGIGCGSMVHALAAALGLSALIAASQPAFLAVRVLGALYLVWFGGSAVLAAIRGRGLRLAPAPNGQRLRIVFRRAVAANLANGKLIVFYLAILPQFVDPARGRVGAQLFLLGTLLNLLNTLYLCMVGTAAGKASAWLARSERLRRWLDGLAGVVFVGLGLRLAFAGQGKG